MYRWVHTGWLLEEGQAKFKFKHKHTHTKSDPPNKKENKTYLL